MRKITELVCAIVLFCFLPGCATIANGTSQKILVTSVPDGATVLVDGKSVCATPVIVPLERRRDHEMVFSKDGFRSEMIKITHVTSQAVAGNTLIFGPLGWAFDALTGCQYKLIPGKVHVDMQPQTSMPSK